jgi:hypothetical protein
MLLAAGAAWLDRWSRQPAASVEPPFGHAVRNQAMAALPARVNPRVLNGLAWVLLGVCAILGVLLFKPSAPIQSGLWDVSTSLSDLFTEMVGWPDLVEQVAGIYAGLPPAEKAQTAILAGNYGEAGALELYGAQYGLPRVISGGNSMWERGFGDPEPQTVIVVGFTSQYAGLFFKDCQVTGTVSNRYGVRNEESTAHTSLFVCREARRPWAEMWEDLRWYQ